MANLKSDYSGLTKEKRLWDIYKSSRDIPSSKFNIVSTVSVAILLVVSLVYGTQTITDLLLQVRHLANTGLSLAFSTLGLLLAGFTVFATISQPQLSIAMSTVQSKVSELSCLKHNYFIFLRVFIYYLVFIVFCLSIIMFGQEGGLISVITINLPHDELVKSIVIKFSYVTILTGYYFLVMQLKSFVFNIYHSVMTALRWEAENGK